MKTFSHDGIWWVPGKEDKFVSGTLEYSRDKGITLTLSGFAGLLGSRNELPMIVGTTYDSKKLSLHECTKLTVGRRAASYNAPHMESGTTYMVNTAFHNADFSGKKKITFKSIDVSYYHIDEWVGISGFQRDMNAVGRKIKIEYKQPAPIKLGECEHFTYELIFYPTFPGSNRTINKEQTIKQKIYLRVASQKGEKSFDEYKSRIDSIGKLLSLAHPEYTIPHIIKGRTKNNRFDTGNKLLYDPVDICYDVPVHKDVEREVHFIDFLFLFSQIKDTFNEHLAKWFKVAQELDIVIMLLYSTSYNVKMFFEQKFITLVQALEVYCRIRGSNEYLLKEEFNKRKKEIFELTPEEYHTWLNSQFSNMPNLRARITKIIRDIKPILTIPYAANFISKIVKTRNYLTHYSTNIKGHSADSPTELSALVHNLRMLLECLLLKEIGFSNKQLKAIVSHRKYRSTRALANRFLRKK